MASSFFVFSREVISASVFECSVPKSVIVGISGSGKVDVVSVMMAGWKLSLYVAPSHCSSSFIVLENLSDALGPRSKLEPSKSVHRPWKSVSVLGSRIGLFRGLLPLYFLGLESCLLFMSVGIFDSLPSGWRDGFDLTMTPPFLNLSCSYVEFTFFVCSNLYELIMTEICINTLLSSLLDR